MSSPSAHETVAKTTQDTDSRLKWLQDHVQFVQAFAKNPLGIGAILPSSRALAAAITAHLQPGSGKVLELGSGTGAFTQYMLTRGFDPADLILVEQDAALAARLRRRFPQSTLLQIPAQTLHLHYDTTQRDIVATVCGLPLRNMNRSVHAQMLKATFDAMRPEGALYLFTYGPTCPVSAYTLNALGLTSRLTAFVVKNLPPACVFCITRVPDATQG
ncbi:class I SAM-dependent methyltransferase [Pusillimonas sp. NJUB218]|uniref:class I SAM-dependent methyltransferase n=1 Tax=Pusillimonas sp. NJUB218 TaxID=2023230 RepID=UPI000F4B8854|nr:methyltransferase domain-containing protein [Pusillimonas sp. NJUB218]ROT45584.1 hypothetical protein CHR62_07515 [Pusillimonas sp. NJUB218]